MVTMKYVAGMGEVPVVKLDLVKGSTDIRGLKSLANRVELHLGPEIGEHDNAVYALLRAVVTYKIPWNFGTSTNRIETDVQYMAKVSEDSSVMNSAQLKQQIKTQFALEALKRKGVLDSIVY